MEREYIAYISYRHTPVDLEAAIAIQRRLERYRIPKALRKDGKVHLGVVFRDTDELNVSSDLSQSLRESLDKSEYLLVLCSPEYKQSEWCRQEITYFLEHHDMDHVVPVVVNGMPYEAFPDELIVKSIVDGKEVVSEPLAANVAGETVKEMKQNIKREYLRIVAKLLGCHYDELVQRQKRYETKRKAAAVGTAFAVLLAFVVLLLVKNAQVSSRYLEARQNQARYLSTVALEQYQSGDAKSALESVLTILPEDGEEGPVVPEQMYALATALNAYNTSYVPEKFISVPEKNKKVLSGDLAYLFSYSDTLLEVYETKYGYVEYTLKANSFFRDHSELKRSGAGDSTLSCVVPTEGTKFLALIDGDIFEFDLDDHQYYRCVASNTRFSSGIYYADGKAAGYTAGGVLTVYDCATGDKLYEKDFNANSEETSVEYSIRALDWSDDGGLIAVGFDYSHNDTSSNLFRDDAEKNRQEDSFFANNPAMGLVLIDTASGSVTKLSGLRTTEVSFAGDAIGAVHEENMPYDVVCRNSYVSPPARWSAAVYDVNSKKCVYQSDRLLGETYNTFGFSKGELSINAKARSVYSLWLGKTGMVLDAESKSILYIESFRADIVKMAYHRNANETIVLSNGSAQFMSISEPEFTRMSVLRLDTEVKDAAKTDDRIFLITNTGLVQCGISKWKDTVTVKSGEADLSGYKATAFDYFTGEQGTLRLVGYNTLSEAARSDGSFSALELYPCLSDVAMFSYISEDPTSRIKAYNVSSDAKRLSVLEQRSDKSLVVSLFDLSDGATELSCTLTSGKDYTETVSLCGFTGDGKRLWVAGSSTVSLYSLEGKAVCLAECQSRNKAEKPVLTEDEKRLVWVENDAETGEDNLVALDLDTLKTEKRQLPKRFVLNYKNTILPGEGATVIIYNDASEALVYDTQEMSCLNSVELQQGSKIALLGNKTELLAAAEETVTIYDLYTGKPKSSIVLPYLPDSIITDSGSDAFAVSKGAYYTSENDNGWMLGGTYLISLDEDRSMYLTAFIEKSTYDFISPSGGEIIAGATDPGSFEYRRILSFEELMAKA